MKKKYSILLVDDQDAILDLLETILENDDYQIYRASNADEAMKILEKHYIHLIISDQVMPGMTGTDMFQIVKDMYPDTLRILITAYPDIENAMDAINRAEVYRFIPKPWQNQDMLNTVKRGLEYFELRKELKRLMVIYRSHKEILNKLPLALNDKHDDNILYLDDCEDEEYSQDELNDKRLERGTR